MLAIRARASGRQPSELLPAPVENELAESDFNDAVTLTLYLFERRRDESDAREAADKTALALARIIGPARGLEIEEADTPGG